MVKATLLILCAVLVDCTGIGTNRSDDGSPVTFAQVEELRSLEALLPLAPDSVVAIYKNYDRETFYKKYTPVIEDLRRYIDSLNTYVESWASIETLAVDHTVENFGSAGRVGRTVYLSSSYFFMFDDVNILHSVITHEFGHIHYDALSADELKELSAIWLRLQELALLYLFRDGEYSGNARFGGHPYDSAEEFFASAFNLLNNRSDELRSRLVYVDPPHRHIIARVERLVAGVKRRGQD